VDESRALGGAVARASPLPGLYICPCLAINAINAMKVICYQSCSETNGTAVSKPPHQTWTNTPLEFFFRTGVPSFPASITIDYLSWTLAENHMCRTTTFTAFTSTTIPGEGIRQSPCLRRRSSGAEILSIKCMPQLSRTTCCQRKQEIAIRRS
jgi:hypothetical protein